ncbi:hypothetical protein TNIN_145571 [Trichonephila inaurata madagascariensis]|uniref:Uncharacterized protein n=1 Tax=Trichonephila inaurata madagascariensis TaxID=2747483 RepID=A0A8X7BNB3_9ARAC|nr:hypothetical protein TNIN_145571 [Trichonephila inaurata madagascariensis]
MPPQASGKAVKKAGKAQKAVRAGDKKKRKKRRKVFYFHLQSLEKIHPDTGISSKALPSEFLRERYFLAHRRPLPLWLTTTKGDAYLKYKHNKVSGLFQNKVLQ